MARVTDESDVEDVEDVEMRESSEYEPELDIVTVPEPAGPSSGRSYRSRAGR